MEVIALITIIVIAAVLAVLLAGYTARLKYEGKFRQWQEAERRRGEEEKERAIREAINQSRAVLGGKFTEQMAPYLPPVQLRPYRSPLHRQPDRLHRFPRPGPGRTERNHHHGS